MGDLILGWMRPTGAQATLAKAADILSVEPFNIIDSPTITPPVHNDFWGTVVITYEAGRVAVEKREIW